LFIAATSRITARFLPGFIGMVRLGALFATKIPLFIVARGHELYPEMVEIAKKYGVPIARTQDSTTAFIAALIGYLNVELAPRITRHGVLIEVYGEGEILIKSHKLKSRSVTIILSNNKAADVLRSIDYLHIKLFDYLLDSNAEYLCH